MSSIYLLKIPPIWNKLFLTGTRNFVHINKLLNLEKQTIILNNVEMCYTETFEEYDYLLSKNIVFIHSPY